MPYDKVLKLANKFAEKTVFYEVADRDRIQKAKFYDNFERVLKAIINELGGELTALRHKNMDSAVISQIAKLYSNLINIAKELDLENPYPAAEKFVDYIGSLQLVIAGCEKSIQRHFKNEIKIDSLKKLLKLHHIIKSYLAAEAPKSIGETAKLMAEKYQQPPSTIGKEDKTLA